MAHPNPRFAVARAAVPLTVCECHVPCIAAIAKGRLQRAHLRAEYQWMAEAERTSMAAERARLENECNAILEKRSRWRLSLGPWDFVMWRERLVRATATALTCQRVSAVGEPLGTPTTIPYAAMRTIHARADDSLHVRTEERSHTFQLGARDEAERWTYNLVALAAAAGHTVPGFCHSQVDR